MTNERHFISFVSEDEFREFVRTKKPSRLRSEFSTLMETTETYDGFSFRCHINLAFGKMRTF